MVELVATAHQSADAFPVTRACQALGLSRATYYRWQRDGACGHLGHGAACPASRPSPWRGPPTGIAG